MKGSIKYLMREESWRGYSLFLFKTLWNAEIKGRGIKGPKLIERSPCLVNRAPEKLLEIEELKRLAKDFLIVATGNLSHYGIAYNTPRELNSGNWRRGVRICEGCLLSAQISSGLYVCYNFRSKTFRYFP